jgi:starch phosphorylase
MGLDLEELIDEERSGPGQRRSRSSGGLFSRLPGHWPGCQDGYGIRYDYGMFKQNIIDGRQMESPDYWLEYGNPWEFERHKTRYTVRFGGRGMRAKTRAGWKPKRLLPWPTIRLSRVMTPMPPTPCVCGAPRPAAKLTR